MSDNSAQNGTDNISTDELVTQNGGAAVGGVKVQRAKMCYGDDGDARDVSAAFPMPVEVAGTVPVSGAFYPATQPVSGTFWQATQPVSGTFWQATQPVSAASLPLPAGAASETTLAAVLAAFQAEDSPSANGSLGMPMLCMRYAADTVTTDNDGDWTVPKVDENGRLKVSSQPASYPDGTGNITASAQTVFLNVDRASNVTISMVATSLVGHNATFEYSNNSTNGTDGTWYVVQAARSNANTVDTATGVLTATPAYGWEISVNAYKWIRVRATAHTSGTASYLIKQGTYATEPVPVIQVTGTQPISGTVTATGVAGTAAHSAAASGNPVQVGGVVATAVSTAEVAGDTSRLQMTTGGQLSVKPYGLPETDWTFTGALTTAVAVAAKAAAAAGIRNYCTDVSYQNTSAVATTVQLLDGATVLAQFNAPANMALPAVVTFTTPRKGTAATAMNVNCGTAGANVLINLGGYQAV